MSDNPYSTPANEIAERLTELQETESWRSVIGPLLDVAGWSRFLGITLIVIGAFYCLTIIGAIVGWVPIWLGILMLKSGDNLRNGTIDASHQGIQQLSKAIKIAGITACVFLILLVLYFLFIIVVLFLGVASSTGPIPTSGP